MKINSLALRLEELGHKCSAFFLQNAAHYLALRVQSLRSEHAEAAFLVARTVNHASHLRPTQCSGAHYARLNGDVERAVGKVFAAELVGSRRYSLHFGVRCHIAERLRKVMRPRNDAVARHYHGAHGYLSLVARSLRLHKSAAHKLLVLLLLFCILHVVLCLQVDT